MRFFHILVIAFVILSATAALANPGQTGSTGLINVPSADTLDSGNICIGAWSNYSRNSNQLQKNALIVPVTVTIGIGAFWEVYGAYPNILFNADEDASGRGTMDIGTKLRFLGSRDSLFKMAAEFLAQRHVSENMALDGATDLSTKLMASYSKGNAGIHLYGGYLFPGSVKGVAKDNEILFGVGLEYMLLARLKVSGEVTGITGRRFTDDYSMEASGGLQYYLSPHLTLNASAGTGLGNNDTKMRLVFGISSCHDVGSYVKQIPHIGKKTIDNKQKVVLKQLKIIPVSTLPLKASSPETTPLGKLEVDADKEDVIIKSYGQITIAPQQATSNLTSPGILVEVPLKSRDEEISLNVPRKTLDNEASAIDYTMNSIGGMTPMYGIDVKGSQVAIPAVVVLPEHMTVYRKFRLPDVTFGFDQWTLSNEGIKMLSEVADQIRKDKKWLYLKVDGHTDAIGSLPYNMDLSLKRAIAVATCLINHEGIEASKIFIKGLGKSTAIADNSTVDGRKKNRRTEILFLVSKEGQ